MRKFEVVNEENLYGGKVGNLIAESSITVILNIDGEDVVFNRNEVKEVI